MMHKHIRTCGPLCEANLHCDIDFFSALCIPAAPAFLDVVKAGADWAGILVEWPLAP